MLYVLPITWIPGSKPAIAAPEYRGFDSIIPKVITAKPRIRKIKRQKQLIPLSSSQPRTTSRSGKRIHPNDSIMTDYTLGYDDA